MTLLLYIAVFALFMLLTGFRLFAEGMFVDGVTYAAISRNLADGIGTFWEPCFSATLSPQFHGHPPLAFGLQGLAFKIFGDSLLVERFYSLLTFILTGYLIVLIWENLTGEKKSGWIPLLVWILLPMVSWAAASNLLDNTLGIFTTLAILLVLKGSSHKSPIYLIIGGFSLFAGLLTKGPFALFPWVLPFLWEFTRADFSLKKALTKTAILVVSTLIPLILLVTVLPRASASLHAYWEYQLVGSLGGIKTVSSRLYIIGTLFSQLVFPAMAAGIAVWVFRKHLNKEKILQYRRPAFLLMLLGLCGVLPILISLKQSSFYILAALPAFALMIALPVWAILQQPLERVNFSQPRSRIFRIFVWLFLFVSLVLPPLFAHHSRRDQKELTMIRDFSTVIPPGSTIRINPLLFTDWSLHSYFARYSRISLDQTENPSANFYLNTDSGLPDDSIPVHWIPIRQLNGFVLFKK